MQFPAVSQSVGRSVGWLGLCWIFFRQQSNQKVCLEGKTPLWAACGAKRIFTSDFSALPRCGKFTPGALEVATFSLDLFLPDIPV